jgi:hypothetical protein
VSPSPPLARLLVPAPALAPAERSAAADERGVARSVGVALGEAAAVAPGPAVAVVALGEAPAAAEAVAVAVAALGAPLRHVHAQGAPPEHVLVKAQRALQRGQVLELQKVPAWAVGVAVAHHAHIRDGARVGGKEAHHLVLRALVREVAHERRERGGARQRKHRPRGAGRARLAVAGRRPGGARARAHVGPGAPAGNQTRRRRAHGRAHRSQGARAGGSASRAGRAHAHAHAPDGGRSRCSEPGCAAAWPHASQGTAGRAPSHGTGTRTRRRGEVTGAAEGVVGGLALADRLRADPRPEAQTLVLVRAHPRGGVGREYARRAARGRAGEPARRPEPPCARAHRAKRAERVRDAGESPFGFIRPRLSSDEIRKAKDGGGFEDTRGEREGKVSRRSNAGAGRAAAERRKKRAFRGMMTAGTMARERHARNCVARENGSSRTRATHHDPVFVCPISSETALPRCPVAGKGCGERSGAERAARRAPDGVRSNANAWCFG